MDEDDKVLTGDKLHRILEEFSKLIGKQYLQEAVNFLEHLSVKCNTSPEDHDRNIALLEEGKVLIIMSDGMYSLLDERTQASIVQNPYFRLSKLLDSKSVLLTAKQELGGEPLFPPLPPEGVTWH